MDLGDIFRYIIAPASGAVILWELWSGKALNRGWSVIALRAEKPVWYWVNITIQCVAVAGILILLNRTGH